MTTVVILGSRGMLGQAMVGHFSRSGARIVALSRSEFDIAKDPFEKVLPRLNEATAVVNCAGVIKPMIVKTPIEDVLRVNAIFPRNLARACAQRKIPLFQITTDCAYSGRKGVYDENDLFDADDVYGMTKSAGEPPDCMILRTSIVGEENGQSRSLLEWARSNAGKEIKGFVNHRWNGMTTLELAKGISTILDRGLYQPRLFHVFSPQVVTKAELMQMISNAYDLKLRVTPVDAPEGCDRSLTSIHSLSGDIFVKPLPQQLSEMRRLFTPQRVQ